MCANWSGEQSLADHSAEGDGADPQDGRSVVEAEHLQADVNRLVHTLLLKNVRVSLGRARLQVIGGTRSQKPSLEAGRGLPPS